MTAVMVAAAVGLLSQSGYSDQPDTDRDDLVDIGVDVESFGPDTGTIVYRADQDEPYVVIPLASVPAWYGGLPVHAYISQGGMSAQAVNYGCPMLAQSTSFLQMYSLHTCVSGVAVTSEPAGSTNYVKRVTVIRPRGGVVAFDFASSDGSTTNFQSVGYPIGVDSNRTYLLRVVGPDTTNTINYDLCFESGVIHEFRDFDNYTMHYGPIAAVRHVDGRRATVKPNFLPGGVLDWSVGLGVKIQWAHDSRYDVTLMWGVDTIEKIIFASWDGALAITNTLSYGASSWDIVGLSKVSTLSTHLPQWPGT